MNSQPNNTPSNAYRFLTGAVGGLIAFAAMKLAAMMMPSDGAVLIKALMDAAAFAFLVIVPIRSVAGEDVTYGGVIAKNGMTP